MFYAQLMFCGQKRTCSVYDELMFCVQNACSSNTEHACCAQNMISSYLEQAFSAQNVVQCDMYYVSPGVGHCSMLHWAT